jgi:hypothetical protein
MSRRPQLMLVAALCMAGLGAVAGVGAAWQPGAASGLLVAAVITLTVAAAATRMLARTTAATHPVPAEVARDAWLHATIAQSPAHADARALMRPRPPSVSR